MLIQTIFYYVSQFVDTTCPSTAPSGYDPLVLRTGVAVTSFHYDIFGVFRCPKLTRNSGDYNSFSVGATCVIASGAPSVTLSPTSPDTCKESKRDLNISI